MRKSLQKIPGPLVVEGKSLQGAGAVLVLEGVECVLVAPNIEELTKLWNQLPGSAVAPLNPGMVQNVLVGSAEKSRRV